MHSCHSDKLPSCKFHGHSFSMMEISNSPQSISNFFPFIFPQIHSTTLCVLNNCIQVWSRFLIERKYFHLSLLHTVELTGEFEPGMYANTAILAALYHREKTGEGQHLDVSLFDSQVIVAKLLPHFLKV